ncbi:hypothetical protein C0989_007953 [Termitomyces sp. Mn162]|nr:hypothetical protein C0989_007953 [Termitomyces sp. Mn162]
MSAPQLVVQQPIASQGMIVNPKNSLNKPDINGEGREWSYDLLDCNNGGTFCKAWWLPCIVYGSNTGRLSYLERNSSPDPDHGGVCSCNCCLYNCCGAVFQITNRAHIRDRYGIKGDFCTDCLASCFCTPCALTQEEAEIDLEEKALIRQQVELSQKA